MSAAHQLTPLGFRPWEISALVNGPVVRQHSEEASFLWSARRRASRSAAFDLANLAALDRRVEAHLAGLRQAGDVGWSACRENLERADAGVVFTLGALAFGHEDRHRMHEVVLAATASEDLVAGLMSALGWLGPGHVARPIEQLISSVLPIHRVIGIRALSFHRFQYSTNLTRTLDDPSPEVRAAALRYCGECQRRDCVAPMRAHLSETDDRCRFWAAWSLALMTGFEGVQELLRFVDYEDPELALIATDMAVRVLSASDAKALVRHLVTQSQWVGLTEAAVGALGDSLAIPWLLQRMKEPIVSRVAGAAFAAITGIDLAKADLTQVGSAGFRDEDLPGARCPYLDEVLSLPMPSAELVADWWSDNEATFPPGMRLLGGRPVDRLNLIETLRHSNQLMRRSAALELARQDQGMPLFDVRARGRLQQAILDSWTL